MPDNFITRDLTEELRRRNLIVDTIVFSGQKLGSYYLAQGKDLKNQSVIYDRAHSAFSELKPGVIDWDHAARIVLVFARREFYPDITQGISLFIPDFSPQIVLTICLKTTARSNPYDKQDFQIEYFGYGVFVSLQTYIIRKADK